jgi:type II secretory pathway component GspD/PulD (secretin)
MKKVRRLEDFLITLMRITLIQCILAGLFVGISWAHDSRAQSALSQKVTVDIQNEEIKTIFAQLEKQTNVKFVFSSKLIQSGRRASIKAQTGTLSDVLDALLKPWSCISRIKNDLIVIKPDHALRKMQSLFRKQLKT